MAAVVDHMTVVYLVCMQVQSSSGTCHGFDGAACALLYALIACVCDGDLFLKTNYDYLTSDPRPVACNWDGLLLSCCMDHKGSSSNNNS